jgi:hypothetical protein
MSRLIGMLLMVVAIWVGVEVYLNGTQGAFGGALASLDGSAGTDATARDPRTIPQRAGAAVGRAHEEADQRRSRLLGE